jgi:hypothetical protein
MKRIWIFLLIVVAAIGIWYFAFNKKSTKEESPKDNPIAVSQHSDSFNMAMNKMLGDYTAMTESFVNWDSAAIDQHAAALEQSLSNINFHELKDSTIYQTATSYRDNFKNDLNTIQQATDLTKKRQALNSFSQNLYDLLRIVRYDGEKVYLQECPMAFNDNDPGLWLSRSIDIRNPYLGLHHPKYGKAMLECGDTKDSLNYAASATP